MTLRAPLASALCAAALLLMTLAPAAAQQPPATGTDRALLSACLRDAQQGPQACIGSIAVPCVRAEPPASRSEAEAVCARRETALWRERMDAAAGVYAQRLDSGQRSRFGALQRGWEGYVAQKCAFLAEIQPVQRVAAMQAACDLREVATRSLEIEKSLRAGQASAGPSRRNAPPRLER
jgi:hypothetical protein